jgi:hypothetical protein
MSLTIPPGSRQISQTQPTVSQPQKPVADLPPVLGPNGEMLGDDFGLGGGSKFEAKKPTPPASQAPVTTPRPSAPAPASVATPSLSAPTTSPASLMVRSMRPMEPLAGGLIRGAGAVQQLNNNNPEIITTLDKGGIAVSTLSKLPPLPAGAPASAVAARERVNAGRLGHSFNGEFRLFSSNQNRTGAPIHQTVALHNPGKEPITVTVKNWASTTSAESPYKDTQKGPDGKAFANRESIQQGVVPNGPAMMTAADVLRGKNELPEGSRTLVIPPGQTRLLPSRQVPNNNEMMVQGTLHSSGPVQAAVVYNKTAPDLARVNKQLATEALITTSSHDKTPTDPNNPEPGKPFIFGRVAGVSEASTYKGVISNSEDFSRFVTTGAGEQSFAFNTKQGNDLGAGRVESAAMVARNPNSAYASHLNYGAEFNMGGVFHNPTNSPKKVQVYLDSPVPSNDSRVMRGVFEVSGRASPEAQATKNYLTVSQTQQTRSRTPMAEFTIPPGGSYELNLRTIYPANNTGPHALRVVTSETTP